MEKNVGSTEPKLKLRLNRESLRRLTTEDREPHLPGATTPPACANTTGINCSHPLDACT